MEWIDVNKELPPMGVKCLCCGAYGGFYVAEFFHDRDGVRWYATGKHDPNPIAWMKIPDQPFKQQRRKPAKK